MRRICLIFTIIFVLIFNSGIVKAQENKLKFSGNFLTDQRFLLGFLRLPLHQLWNCFILPILFLHQIV